MRITAVEAIPVDRYLFAKVHTDAGITGLGESGAWGFLEASAAAIDKFGRYLVGQDPLRIEHHWQYMYRWSHFRGAAIMGAISALEMACWDIIGKALGQPVYNLLGGQVHEKVRSYTYLYPAAESTTEDVLSIADVFGDAEAGPERAAHYVEQGFTAVKFDPVMPMSAFDPRQLSIEALENAELVTRNMREAVGSKADLLIGTHGQMTTSSAIRLAKRLEPFDPLWFEEPVPPENKKEMGRVARSTTIPVATGERLATKYEFAELLDRQAAAILQPALGRVGGILEAKKIAGMAEAHYVEIAPHLYCGPIEAAANIQIATCSPNFLIQESIETFGGFHAELLKEPIRWEDGYIIPPTGPGLGVELNEEVAARHPYTGPIFVEMIDRPVY
jgi:galactonate dehydratase